ncbi:MAG: type II toxin-antitoxin system HicA family toxin [Bacteroidetes bacterium]|nr:type II toxin-antitoxin system HicA family toxin [Bacteroidota bacterium]
MPKLKVLSGEDIITVFKKFDFEIAGQKGSHVKLTRLLQDASVQSLTIPNHKEIDRGTLKAILRQSSKYIPESELRKYFYTE